MARVHRPRARTARAAGLTEIWALPQTSLSHGRLHWSLTSDREALERAAAGWGVELEYTDTWGRTHPASDETLQATLAALGVPDDSDTELERAATERDLKRWSRAFDPAVVVYQDSDSIPLRIPA